MLVKRGGMHTTSDFPSLLADVANKTLRAAYDAAPQTWRPFAKMISASDFRALNVLQIGDAPELLEVLEHGEFTSGTITESKETVRLKTWGRIFAITRQALINDDLGAFAEIPAAFGRKSADKMSDLAWSIITTNAALADGFNLFSSNHANLSATSDPITVASLGAARAAMRQQKGIDGSTPMNLVARYLIVPASLETIADQYVSVITPGQTTNANPFQPGGRTPLTVIAESRLDANSILAWYVAADASQVPLLHFVTLDGQEGPEVRQMEGFDVDGIKYRCRLDVNFAAADYRAGYKNPGAAPAPGLLTSPSPMGGRVPEPQVKERVVVEGQQQTGETRDEKLRPRR
jgi:phage major head subunit gpT-like protein